MNKTLYVIGIEKHSKPKVHIPCCEWNDDLGSGLEILVSDIPKHVKILRFYHPS